MDKIEYLNLKKMHEPITQELNNAYQEVFERQWYINGIYNKKFEEDFARYCSSDYCIGVGNGLDAIRLILEGMGIGSGDEVIVPANTFIATVLAITYVGATPVLVDADERTYNIAMDKIEEKITSKTKAIIAVHLYGNVVDFRELKRLKEKYHIMLIEDAAQAHGGILRESVVGSLGDAAAFSFYPGKNLGAFGDGGAVVTSNKGLAEKIRAIANYGSKEKYVHIYKGYNSRLDELQAAFLDVKLKYLDNWNDERRKIAMRYQNEIKNDILRLPIWNGGRDHVFHVYPVLCKNRKKLIDYLKEKGIGTNIHYPTPIYKQKAYIELSKREEKFPVTEMICYQEVSIPLYPGLAIEEQDYIIDCLNDYIE